MTGTFRGFQTKTQEDNLFTISTVMGVWHTLEGHDSSRVYGA